MRHMKGRIFSSGIEHKKARWGWVFIIPSLAFFSLFSFFPILNALHTSLFRKKLLSLKPPRLIGFDNYIYLLQSPDFWNSIRATVVFTIGTFVPMVLFSLIFALFIMSRKRFQKFFQTAYYSPAVLSSVVVAAIWLLILDPRGLGNQLVNFIFQTPGIDHKWLAHSAMVQISTMMVYFWKYVGYFTIIFLVGLGSIPKSIHEAARTDGATGWTDFWYITLPLLKPTTVLVSIMSMLQCLKTFSTQYLFTQGGAPMEPINVITLNLYHTAIRDRRIGLASAMSIILFCMMLFFTWLQFKTFRSDEVRY
jgi:multiple sugar transport system permease protein